MASKEEVELMILEGIEKRTPSASAAELLQLAEALAWLRNPSQPHGGQSAQD